MPKLAIALKDREEELESYFRFVALVETETPRLLLANRKTHKTRGIDEDVVKILKANCFLLLYNVVEATVRDAFSSIYDAIQSDRCRVKSLNDSVRSVWFDAEFRRVSAASATPNSYRSLARELVQAVLADTEISLDIGSLKMDGNLDAAKIRQLCQAHGVSHKTLPQTKAGEKLLTIKKNRNALAHGSLSFTECGRDFTMSDLQVIKHESVLYLRGILRNIDKYLTKKAYT